MLNKILIFTSFPRAQIHKNMQTLIASFDITGIFLSSPLFHLNSKENLS